jgi:phage terminase small subunit
MAPRGIDVDAYRGETPLPNDKHEKFCQAMATGAVTQSRAIQAAYGAKKSAAQMGNNLLRQPHVKARIDYLKRERANRWDGFEETVFEGFEDLLNTVLDDVAELVRLCDGNGLAREAAQARDVLTTISSRVLAQLHSLRAADKQQVVRTDNLIQTLESLNVVTPR